MSIMFYTMNVPCLVVWLASTFRWSRAWFPILLTTRNTIVHSRGKPAAGHVCDKPHVPLAHLPGTTRRPQNFYYCIFQSHAHFMWHLQCKHTVVCLRWYEKGAGCIIFDTSRCFSTDILGGGLICLASLWVVEYGAGMLVRWKVYSLMFTLCTTSPSLTPLYIVHA